MGIDIHWENEHGDPLATFSDSASLVQRFLPAFDAIDFPLLRYVDPAGDTTFNQFQIPDVISELERLLLKRNDPKVAHHLKATIDFIQQAKERLIHT